MNGDARDALVKWRVTNLIFCGMGTLVFAFLFAYVQLNPEGFDKRVRDFALAKVESKVTETLEGNRTGKLFDSAEEAAGMFSDKLKSRVSGLRRDLDAGLPEFIASVLAAACELDCEGKEKAEVFVRGAFESRIARYGVGIDRLESLIVGEYDRISEEVRADISTFSLSNLVALGFAFLLAVFRGPAARHLVPISFVLALSTLMAVIWYTFGQDWVTTILFNNYWGAGYAVFIGFIFVLLTDIAVFRATLTSFILNGIGGIFGSIDFAPC